MVQRVSTGHFNGSSHFCSTHNRIIISDCLWWEFQTCAAFPLNGWCEHLAVWPGSLCLPVYPLSPSARARWGLPWWGSYGCQTTNCRSGYPLAASASEGRNTRPYQVSPKYPQEHRASFRIAQPVVSVRFRRACGLVPDSLSPSFRVIAARGNT